MRSAECCFRKQHLIPPLMLFVLHHLACCGTLPGTATAMAYAEFRSITPLTYTHRNQSMASKLSDTDGQSDSTSWVAKFNQFTAAFAAVSHRSTSSGKHHHRTHMVISSRDKPNSGQSRGRTLRRSKAGDSVSLDVLLEGHFYVRQPCPEGCTDRGVCNEELGRCDCQRGWTGPDCSRAPSSVEMARLCQTLHFHHFQGNCTDTSAISDPSMFCVNNCNGRGQCRAGWCHCQRGFWGMDCSLSLDSNRQTRILAGLGYTVRLKKPSVYVYDLPHRLTTWRSVTHSDRPLHVHFYQRLLSAGVLTADAERADYFFLPVSLRGPSEGMLLEAAVAYVRHTWPYWDRYKGARHIVIHVGDSGRSEMATSTLQLMRNTTFLTHWGLTQDVPSSGWKASHIPDRDIVIPIQLQPFSGRSTGLETSPLHPKSNRSQSSVKDIEMLFAGRICGGREPPDGTKVPNCGPINRGYSQGVRQAVHQHHWNRTGFVIAVSVPDYFDKLSRTRFCLAPSGGGHGHRQTLVAFSGCTPLVISDHVLQPFEPALNWSRFALTLPQASIPRLHKILPRVSAQRYERLQAALSCAAQHFAWSTSGGGFMQETGRYDAFETTLEILRMMREYPGIPQHQYYDVDASFRAFMECRSPDSHLLASVISHTSVADTTSPPMAAAVVGGGGGDGGVSDVNEGDAGVDRAEMGTANNSFLCSVSVWDSQPCEKCLKQWLRAVPGGVLCCNHTDNLAQCPRLWP